MKIENAKYHLDWQGEKVAILCTMNGQPQVHIPIDENNTHYVELKKMIDAGEVTVGDAEPLVT